MEETHPGVGEESIPEEQPEEHGVAAVTNSPLKVKEEVVNCICRVSEETGLMVQCDVCLCWQHAACMELSEDTLPRRYVCFVCSNAPGQYISSCMSVLDGILCQMNLFELKCKLWIWIITLQSPTRILR